MSVLTGAGGLAMPPEPPLMTAEDFLRTYPVKGWELVNGVAVALAPTMWPKGLIVASIVANLFDFVRSHGLGRVVMRPASFLVRRNPDTLRSPSVMFMSYDRVPSGPFPEEVDHPSPDLAVEVRQESEPWGEVFAKVEEYHGAGVSVVVLIDAESRAVMVCRPGGRQESFGAGQTLRIDDVLPGFALAVDELYE